jgi:superfamily II DNA or RNA helicase
MSISGMKMPCWAGTDSPIDRHVVKISRQCLAAYRENPLLVTEHANIERSVFEGGYEHRQIYELVQNGADEMLASPGRIEVVLTADALYCANEGQPFTERGVETLLGSNLSRKRGFEIGRFGVGFKSILRISTNPQLFSRTGSFAFSEEFAQAEIRRAVGDFERYPVLRIATPISPCDSRKSDPVLDELMSWATTVVKLPLLSDTGEWLHKDLAEFPREFVLFATHVSTLAIADRVTSVQREVTQEQVEGKIVLREDGKASSWKVFSMYYKPSEKARRDAGELADREILPLSWAVPMEGRMGRGLFWAFFPTSLECGLSGILNAPWKTNVDRQYLLPSEINKELIRAAAALAVDSLPAIVEDDDPGWILTVLPGRIDESPPWADHFLNTSIYEIAQAASSIPDQYGIPRSPKELRCSPAHLPEAAYEQWASFEMRPANWPHYTCESRERRARVDRLFAGKQAESIRAWLEALAEGGTPEHSKAALRVAALLWRAESSAVQEEIRNAQIVLTSGDALVAALPGKLFFENAALTRKPDLPYVHAEVAADEETVKLLEEIGVSAADDGGEFRHFIADGFTSFDDRAWTRFWEFADAVPDCVVEALGNRKDLDQIHVRTASGKLRPRVCVMMPGAIANAAEDPDVVVDTESHAAASVVLKAIGVLEKPIARHGSLDEVWGAKYRQEAREKYYAALPAGTSRPRADYIDFWQKECVGPLQPFYELSNASKARFTAYLLSLNEPDWTVDHTTRGNYPRLPFPPPSIWLTRRNGWLSTSLGLRTVSDSVGPELRRWDKFFAVPDESLDVARLVLPANLKDLKASFWQKALHNPSEIQDPRILGEFYAEACLFVTTPPESLCCQTGTSIARAPAKQIAVVRTERELAALVEAQHPVLFVPDALAAERLVKNWNFIAGGNLVRTSVAPVPVGSEIPLVSYFPALRGFGSEVEQSVLIPCSELRVETITPAGKQSSSTDWYANGDRRLYYSASLDNTALLDRINKEFRLGLQEDERKSVLENRQREDIAKKLAAIRRVSTPAGRLVKAVGAEKIRKHLPLGLAEAVEAERGRLAPNQTAELAFAVYGVDVLREFREELAAQGLEPPSRWAGCDSAVNFANSLGFGKEYAGFEGQRRDPLLEIEGPPNLHGLHEFQLVICNKLKRALKRSGSSRSLLCLPTGAGKTRVAVQAFIEVIKAGTLPGPIVWIAQTDELCEQAVQAWSECWRAFGDRRLLSISRLWSTNSAKAVAAPHVVVATIEKLQSCVDEPSYKWLTESSCILVDEAHGAITPEYTKVLRVLGMDFTSREEKQDRCPLIGLTATPFRGSSEEETKRLVARFGGNRLDLGVLGADPYRELQEMGVLARVDHTLVDGTEILLTSAEESELKRFQRLPAAVEERLGTDRIRNRSLLASIKSLDRTVGVKWTAILFATSVQHAQIMAAMLNFEGIAAAAVSSDTDEGARRHYIEKFRKGDIQVLTNYRVLTQGFDAPAVRVIYVARPTFSPNLYQQMIGRGLRGPKNGGKPRCLIINVRDNLERYGLQLAFKHFDHLWAKPSGR